MWVNFGLQLGKSKRTYREIREFGGKAQVHNQLVQAQIITCFNTTVLRAYHLPQAIMVYFDLYRPIDLLQIVDHNLIIFSVIYEYFSSNARRDIVGIQLQSGCCGWPTCSIEYV
jgi:hypothetical protein